MVARRHFGEGGGYALCSDAVEIIIDYTTEIYFILFHFIFLFSE